LEVGEEDTDISNWKEIIPVREDVMLEEVDVFFWLFCCY